MGTEIERKFLVCGDDWRRATRRERMVQAYLSFGPPLTVRVRMTDDHAWLTLKAKKSGIERHEFEYAIPREDAVTLLQEVHTGAVVTKTRYHWDENGMKWEVDEFHGENEGLIIAELELEAADQPVVLPHWISSEVTQDARYLNSNLARTPYLRWPSQPS